MGLRAFAGGKARHGEGQNAIAAPTEPVGRLCGDDQRMGRIEPARHADDQRLGLTGLQPLGQRLDTDVIGLVAVGVAACRVVGDEGKTLDGAAQPAIGRLGPMDEADAPKTIFGMASKSRRIVERTDAQSFLDDPLDIDIGDGQRRRAGEALGFRQLLAKLMDQPWPSQARSVVLSPMPAAE